MNASRAPSRQTITAAVVARVQHRIAEGRDEHLLDQLVHQLPAAAVRQQHLRVLGRSARDTISVNSAGYVQSLIAHLAGYEVVR